MKSNLTENREEWLHGHFSRIYPNRIALFGILPGMKASVSGKNHLPWLIPAIFFLFFSCNRLSRQQPFQEKISLSCGEQTVEVSKYTGTSDSLCAFINVHEDEQTSIEALRKFAADRRINYLFLHHNGERRISFELNSIPYSIDPNRIFTHTGLRKTLEDGGEWSESAQQTIRKFSQRLIRQLKGYRYLIAMHNNTPDNYSILSYLPGGDEAVNTEEVYVNPDMDPDDFIYTTDAGIFHQLKKLKINVILQDNRNFVDDGSLSVYCGMHDIAYLNIETQHGHLAEQLQLMELVRKILSKED